MTSKKQIIHLLLACAAAILTSYPCRAAAQQTKSWSDGCSGLSRLTIANVKEIVTEKVPAGPWQPPDGKVLDIPTPFCRVSVVSVPAADSNIHIEVWLPEAGWNGRLLGTGNGGWAGKIDFGSTLGGLRRNYVTANTDMGTSPSGDGVVGHPDRWADFGYRATHEMTVVAKALARAYYRTPVSHSYFVGCSTGGEQALAEAQRYPKDYNGIVAGAPANNRTHLHSEFLWNYQALHRESSGSGLSRPLIALLQSAVLAACIGKDGGAPTDKFLTDPRTCRFDPESLPHCSAEANNSCFTGDQLVAIKTIYAGPTNPKTGERVYEALPVGTSDFGGGAEQFYPFHWVFGLDWDPMAFRFDQDEDAVDAKLAAVLNANDPDLTAFDRAGGKLIMYGGTSDALVPFPDALDYYERVVGVEQAYGHSSDADALTATQQFFVYYLAPGMAHCGGGSGIDTIGQSIWDKDGGFLSALELWAEKGVPVGTREGTGNGMHRPVCAYPALPKYNAGDPALAASFACVARPRGQLASPASRYLH